jgi:hypothetical protein
VRCWHRRHVLRTYDGGHAAVIRARLAVLRSVRGAKARAKYLLTHTYGCEYVHMYVCKQELTTLGRYHILPGPGGFIPGSLAGPLGPGSGTPPAAEGYPSMFRERDGI